MRYKQAFDEIPQIILPFQKKDCKNSWHLYVMQVRNRKEVFDKLRRAGIGVNVHYIPVYKHPYYQTHGYASVPCENAEKLYENILSLPLYPKLSNMEQDYVMEQVIQSIAF